MKPVWRVVHGNETHLLACSGGTAAAKTALKVGLSPAPNAMTPKAVQF